MSIIVVGPRDEVLPQLKTLGLGEPEMWTVEGRPAKE
jgi:zinc protease